MASAMITPQMVGQAFVNQYYNVLHQSPHLVHRFYTDSSRLTRADAGADGVVQSPTNQTGIHKMVMSLNQEECRAEIKTVDSQDSFAGSVLVLVSGAMHHRNSSKRDFVQTFFLAPQERGYYVLNDIFRYLGEEIQEVEPVKLANGAVEIVETLPIASEAEHDARAFPPSDREEDAAAEEMPGFAEHHRGMVEVDDVRIQDRASLQMVETGRAGSIEQLYVSDDLQTAFPLDVSQEKKSYASILRFSRDNHGAGAQQPASAWNSSWQTTSKSELPVSSHQLHAASGFSTAQPTGGAVAVNTRVEVQANVRSVYVRNLPLGITSLQLQEELGRFGPVKPNGITVRTVQDTCYAFVEFEDSSSVHNAIEVSSVLIGGRKAYIELKRSTFSGGRGRGQGRTNFQGNGLRGSPHTTAAAKGPKSDDRDLPNMGRGVKTLRGRPLNDGSETRSHHGDSNGKSFSQASNGSRLPQRGNSGRS